MGVTVEHVRVGAKTSNGTQTITTADLGGLTPVAAFIQIIRASVDGTAALHASIGYGAVVSASERWAVSAVDENSVETNNSSRRMTEDECIMLLDPTDGTVECEADFDSWVSDGFIIDWGSTNPATAFLITVTFFAGTDTVAHAATLSLPDSATGSTDVTAPGFEPAFVLFAGTRSAFNDTSSANCSMAFGIAANDGADSNFGIGAVAIDGVSTIVNGSKPVNNGVHTNISNSTAFSGHYVDTYDANGFTINNGHGGGSVAGYMAIGFGGNADVWLGDISSPTSTGDDAETGPGFTPQALIAGFSVASGFLSARTGTDPDETDVFSFGVGVASVNVEFSNVISSEDGVVNTNTQSLSDDVFINLQKDQGGTTNDLIATGPPGSGSFDENGFTINYSAVDTGVSQPLFALAIREDGGATVGRMYTVSNSVAGVTTAIDLLRISAPSDAVVVVHKVIVSQETEFGDAASEQMDIQFHRGSTDGSGGATPTARPLEVGDAAFGGTTATGNDTQSTEGVILHVEAANVMAGFVWAATPEERIVLSPSGRLIVELPTAPDDSIDFRVFAAFEEIGG